jgi:intracellular septation protein
VTSPSEPAAPTPAGLKTGRVLRAVVDYGGLVLFAAAYFLLGKDMIKATWVLAAGSILALLIGLAIEKRVAPMPLLTGGAALLFAILASVFHNTSIVKMQPTAIDLVLGSVMLGGAAMKRNPLKALIGGALTMDAEAWRILMIRYGCFFLFEAALNEVFWRTQPEARWVVLHRPLYLGLSLLFSFAQVPFIMKHAHMGEEDAKAEANTES